MAMQYIENRTFGEIKPGDHAELSRRLEPRDIMLFATVTGDINPAHVDADYARDDMFHEVVAHGLWGGGLISAVLGTELPGPGTIYLDQSLKFLRPVKVGDVVTARVRVKEKKEKGHRVLLECECVNQKGETVISGEALVKAPDKKIRRPRTELPNVEIHEAGKRYRQLLDAARDLPPLPTAVAHPCDRLSLAGAMEAARKGLILPILVGPRPKIEAAAKDAGEDITDVEIIDAPHSHAAAEVAVGLVRAGRAMALMKGALHTDELMAAVVAKADGLRTERRISHVFVLDVPHYPKPLFITDAAINIAPSLEEKRDIVQNAIDLAHALGIEQPKVAILSAVETVYPSITSTVEAAALCKMADRRQISGGVLDGPLAFDNAISKQAAEAKGIQSPVAGDADILIAPDLEAGNILAKQLIYLGGAQSAGIVLGARVPIMLTSRADNVLSRLASSALAQLYAHHHKGPAA